MTSPQADRRSPPATACPVVEGFRPLAPEATDEELIAGWARARREAPVFYDPEQGWWCVSTTELFEDVLRRPEDFSSRISGAPTMPVPEEMRDRLPDGWPMHPNLASTDPPEHTRIRKLAQPSFSKRAAEARVPQIRAIANRLIDAFIDRGEVDLATEYTRMIPVNVIAPIWGVPDSDALRLYGWAHEAMLMVINPSLTEEQVLGLAESQSEFDRYVRAVIAERREHPRGEDDLLSELIAATGDEGEPALSDSELMALVTGVIAAGTETTATAMGHAIHSLLGDRSRWDRAVADRSLLPNVVEETLRCRPPVRSITRITNHECELGGVTIPADAIVHMPFLSAGHDETVFDDPDSFDIHRENARQHISFGKWTHFCLGAQLAKVEIRTGLDTLMERVPGMRLADDCALRHVESVGVPPLIDGLRVEWEA
jgi:cytochrome P450